MCQSGATRSREVLDTRWTRFGRKAVRKSAATEVCACGRRALHESAYEHPRTAAMDPDGLGTEPYRKDQFVARGFFAQKFIIDMVPGSINIGIG